MYIVMHKNAILRRTEYYLTPSMLTYVHGGIFMRAVPGGGIFSYFLKYEITQPMHWSTFYSQTFPHHLNHGVRKEIQRLENIYSLKSKSTTCAFTLRMVETTRL